MGLARWRRRGGAAGLYGHRLLGYAGSV